ncbi:MAG: Ig-like domain-containing protein, partial [Dehalococcoidales bacterium]|nr:Ig-like domain-containing protein [Dehalococcoidales bacterium]
RAGTGRWEDVTDKAVFVSNNPQVATVSSSGFVQGVSPGEATISITYTAVPGSANRTSSAEGKVSIMVACQVEVTVVLVPQNGRRYNIIMGPPGFLGRV